MTTYTLLNQHITRLHCYERIYKSGHTYMGRMQWVYKDRVTRFPFSERDTRLSVYQQEHENVKRRSKEHRCNRRASTQYEG